MDADGFEDLPQSLVDIADVIGMAAALRLVAEFGGTVLYIPQSPKPGSRLVEAIGLKAALDLGNAFERERITVPTCRALRTAEQVRRLSAEGLQNPTIARRLGITDRHVRRLKNDPDEDQRQGWLFD